MKTVINLTKGRRAFSTDVMRFFYFMQTITYQVEGVSPLLMHSDTLANPLHPLAIELKEITNKKKKTTEDYLKIAKIQFLAGLYYDEKKGYLMPAKNISATLLGSSKHFKQGVTWKQGALIPEDALFEFKNNKVSPEDLFNIKEHVDMRSVVLNGRSRVITCRPIFTAWSFKFSIYVDEGKFNEKEITNIVNNGGKYVGLCDYRPIYGRFEATKIKN